LIALQEPPKTVDAGAGQARQASVLAYERTANRTIEGLVDLTHRQVISWKTRPGVQPPILMEEYALTAEIVRADSRWRAAMQQRGGARAEGPRPATAGRGGPGPPRRRGGGGGGGWCPTGGAPPPPPRRRRGGAAPPPPHPPPGGGGGPRGPPPLPPPPAT